jgi:mRNA-degrading endonuclease RelE of RelBE toxin-antitoxin system
LTDLSPIQIKVTPEFQRKIRLLSKKYCNIQNDLQPILEKLRLGETLGDRIPHIQSVVYKLRIKNTNIQKGKSGGYRLIYWLQLTNTIILLDIYTKSEQDNVSVAKIKQIITNFES